MQAQRPGVWALLNKWISGRRARAQRRAAQAEQRVEAVSEPEVPEAELVGQDDVGAGDLLRMISDVAWRVLIIGVVAGLLVYALVYLSVVTLPLILAVFLTALLMPMANWLRRPNPIKRSGFGRGPSTAISMIFGLAVLSGVISLIVTPAVSGFDALVDSVNSAVIQLQQLDVPFGLDPALFSNLIDNAWDQIEATITENQDQILTGAWTATTAVIQLLVGLVLMLALTVYFVHSGDQLVEWIVTLLPPKSRPGLRYSGRVAYGVMGRYVRGVAMVGLFDAVGIGIVLIFLIDTTLAIPLIVLTFIGAFLPIIGAFLSGLLAVLVALVTENWVVALIVLAAVILVQQLESNVFAPRIYGQALELPSAVVLIALTIGGIVGGIPGLFLATPIAAVLAALLRNRPPVHQAHTSEEHKETVDTGPADPPRGEAGADSSASRA
ncbi:AI-2E family transporter [Nocardiopsis sp. EMB25]|uniref:AI-2E family transporter n=1 Tax=Nocardiopsis TaxID=2013 RepID=UPI00034AA588|nr:MULTISPECIES: AI-2E family transporter [Nocardiopsis]MCY9784430.1 AI-2E family transporter [Nocardiopsis sp. EMB25]